MVRLTVLANIAAILVNMLELPQCLDDVDVLARPCYHQLRALMQTVVEHFERLQDVAPVLSPIVESLIEHVHDLVEVGRAGQLLAQLPRRVTWSYLLKVI